MDFVISENNDRIRGMLWGYISVAAFLAIALIIGFLTLHVVFFYIIPIILAIIVGFWVMRMIGNMLCRK